MNSRHFLFTKNTASSVRRRRGRWVLDESVARISSSRRWSLGRRFGRRGFSSLRPVLVGGLFFVGVVLDGRRAFFLAGICELRDHDGGQDANDDDHNQDLEQRKRFPYPHENLLVRCVLGLT